MATHPDYIGRSIDVLAFRGGQETPGEVRLEQRLCKEGDPGQICTGVQKLVQRFLLALLTARGSLRSDPEYGTNFLPRVLGGHINTPAQLLSEYAIAEAELGPVLERARKFDDPLDETYASSTAISADVSGGRLSLWIELRTASDVRVQFILPIATLGG